jgi:predicted helicase
MPAYISKPPESPLRGILSAYRATSQTEREKGTYFEELIRTYFRNEPKYADLYSDVWLFSDWAKEHGEIAKDTGIDLVAKVAGTDEYHAIQCKCYAEDYRVRKADIDSFFTASGKKPFTYRLIVTTTNDWSENAEHSLEGQTPPVSKITLHDLENSQIDWEKYAPSKPAALKDKKQLRKHQISALENVKLGLKSADRGKLIMACGTGKTFTSLKIAEQLAGKNKRVLFLVPSLNLLSQTLTEWAQESAIPLRSFAVCSDAEVGKKRSKDEDIVETFAHELQYPATTDAKRLAFEMGKRHDADHMSVVFSTYHSIDVVSRAQNLHGMADFDLIVCDEAHRTTGAVFEDDKESNFVKIHDAAFIRSAKRLYMTATPRIYGNMAKASAERDSITLCSMDDEALYGKQLHLITFSEAVELKLLTDYKVLVLAINSSHVSARIQNLLKDENNSLKVDDAARIIGCWKALSKQGVTEHLPGDEAPMRRAVAFCQVIEAQGGKSKTHKVSSKQIAGMFSKVVEAYQQQEDSDNELICEADHVDGSMNAGEKDEKLTWLKEQPPENTCRILSNVRCLSEGVDVPALDAVLFLTPRNSQVDVVQSVGRVMRNAPGKKRGYVILPVVIPEDMEAHEALNDNKTYKVVWDVLQALRSHDDTFDALVNKIEFDGQNKRKMEVVSITDEVKKKSKSKTPGEKSTPSGVGQHGIGETQGGVPQAIQAQMQFQVTDLERALYAKLVKKCGSRNYWDDWAKDIAAIAHTHITRITQIISNPENTKEAVAFASFAGELRDDLNDSITDAEVIEMLAQHLITKPVFDSLFADYSFASHNPVSKAMQHTLDVLQEHRLDKEADTLEKFYASVARKAKDTNTAEGKQKIVVELYDKFFRNAFPRMTERLGIVYTPVEVVDFIIHSVNDLLKQEFGQTLGSEGVHIIDPFTGTGTFITRLLQSGLITKEQLPHKYGKEIHANEIVLLAYYIAAINIEAVYHGIVGGSYQPFQGICLTDTFRLEEKDLISDLLANNSERRKRQQELDVRVIMGNPPYSGGQKNDNDDAANIQYEIVDKSIKDSYVSESTGNPRSLYDSYIRAYRWASDRIGKCGVIGFVSSAGWLRGKAADGFRKCIQREFDTIYVFDLRGDAHSSGEQRRKEKGNVFGEGSRTPVTITLLVKKPTSKGSAEIFYHDIGDYLDQSEKLKLITERKSALNLTADGAWSQLVPDRYGDWLDQRREDFGEFLVLGNKKDKTAVTLFSTYSSGVKTNRDPWAYNFSKMAMLENMEATISFYNECVSKYSNDTEGVASSKKINDDRRISWSWVLRGRFKKGQEAAFSKSRSAVGCYRPYVQSHLYYDGMFNENRYLMPSLFPEPSSENLLICINGPGAGNGFSALVTTLIPDLNMLASGAQCFPLYFYEKGNESPQSELFSKSGEASGGYTRCDAITDAGLEHFRKAYGDAGRGITKEDLFYYIYGLLHSPEYRSRYADNLSKELPRIPAVNKFADFMAFSKAGRELADWHLNYETSAIHPDIKVDTGKLAQKDLTAADYRVEKMKFAKVKDPESNKSVPDKTTVIYNPRITLRHIPLEAYDYIVNGKPALEWVMERQSVSKDPASGIVNDANLWATETMQNPAYPMELFLRVAKVSVETMRIVNGLPGLEID